MKPKREQRACINAWNRGAEQRARERGQHMVTARLGPVAYAKLQALCDANDCTVRDVIEGFLFGTIGQERDGLSAQELADYRSMDHG